MSTVKTIAQLLEEARERIARIEPADALAAAGTGALIVDMRSDRARERDGIIPGSLHLPRTVLEWRADPRSPSRNPTVGGFERQLILLCDHGYSSSLAAATLVELGFEHAADIVGGFEAWAAAGLPVDRVPPSSADDSLPGMGPPD